jgi:hypothetical protein
MKKTLLKITCSIIIVACSKEKLPDPAPPSPSQQEPSVQYIPQLSIDLVTKDFAYLIFNKQNGSIATSFTYRGAGLGSYRIEYKGFSGATQLIRANPLLVTNQAINFPIKGIDTFHVINSVDNRIVSTYILIPSLEDQSVYIHAARRFLYAAVHQTRDDVNNWIEYVLPTLRFSRESSRP